MRSGRIAYIHIFLSGSSSNVPKDTLFTLVINRIPGPEVIKLFSCSTQLSLKFVQLINLKLQTLVHVNSFLLNIAEHENFSANKYENANYCWHFHIYKQRKFHALLTSGLELLTIPVLKFEKSRPDLD